MWNSGEGCAANTVPEDWRFTGVKWIGVMFTSSASLREGEEGPEPWITTIPLLSWLAMSSVLVSRESRCQWGSEGEAREWATGFRGKQAHGPRHAVGVAQWGVDGPGLGSLQVTRIPGLPPWRGPRWPPHGPPGAFTHLLPIQQWLLQHQYISSSVVAGGHLLNQPDRNCGEISHPGGQDAYELGLV